MAEPYLSVIFESIMLVEVVGLEFGAKKKLVGLILVTGATYCQ